jgi:hypothetical protein
MLVCTVAQVKFDRKIRRRDSATGKSGPPEDFHSAIAMETSTVWRLFVVGDPAWNDFDGIDFHHSQSWIPPFQR